MSRDPLIVLGEIRSAAMEILEFTKGMTKDEFLSSRLTFLAVNRLLEIMGEAAKNVPDSIRESHPEIPWKQICGMKDVVVHQYCKLDEDVIWLAVSKRVSSVLVSVSAIIDSLADLPFLPGADSVEARNGQDPWGISPK